MKWIAIAALALVGCTDEGIGSRCSRGDGGVTPGVQLSNVAAECPSRMCLSYAEGSTVTRATCTAPCESDDDCAPSTKGSAESGLCASDFVCAVPMVVGPLKCQRFCICRDDLVCGLNSDGAGHVITPIQCPNPSPSPSCS